MSAYVWINLTTKLRYMTAIKDDPSVPAGYVLTSGSDGAPDAALKTYTGGLASGGHPAYNGYTDGSGTGQNPNGILR